MKQLGSLQFSFLFLNVIFWAVGIGIVGFVSWTLSSLPNNTEFLSVAFAFLYIILFLGLVIAATGLLGCLGGMSRSICLLKCYSGFMVAFIFIEVAIAIGAYTQQDQIPSLITSTWPKLNNDTKFTLQAGLECCGVNNYTEYGFELGAIPLSCFKVYDTLTVHTKSWTLLFQTPCLQQIENWFSANLPIWVTILILICIVQFVSMGLGVTVIVKIEEQTKVHPAPVPPDEEQPPDGATIVCSESLHPESSQISEFSDQLSLSSASEDTTARKLSEVPEEEEERLSSGVVCCNSKDDLGTSTAGDHVDIDDHVGTVDHTGTSEDHVGTVDHVDTSEDHAGTVDHVDTSEDHVGTLDHVDTSEDHAGTVDHVDTSEDHAGTVDHMGTSEDHVGTLDQVDTSKDHAVGTVGHEGTSEDHVETDKVDAASVATGVLKEEVVVVNEDEQENVDNNHKESALLVFYDDNSKQYENQKSPTFSKSKNEVDPGQNNKEVSPDQPEDSIHGNPTDTERQKESTPRHSTDNRSDRHSLIEEYQHTQDELDKSNLLNDASVNEMIDSKDG